MTSCSSVCSYRVVFSDGTVMYPNLPGHVNVYSIAEQYANEELSKGTDTPVKVVTIDRIR